MYVEDMHTKVLAYLRSVEKSSSSIRTDQFPRRGKRRIPGLLHYSHIPSISSQFPLVFLEGSHHPMAVQSLKEILRLTPSLSDSDIRQQPTITKEIQNETYQDHEFTKDKFDKILDILRPKYTMRP